MPHNQIESSPRVARKRQARKALILETAMGLLGEVGLEGLTVVRLAEALDYTAGALYRYFPSKDALLADMQRHSIASVQRELSRLARAVCGESSDGLLALVATAEGYLAMVQSRPQYVQLINFLLADPRPLIGDEEVAQTAPLLLSLFADVEQHLSAAVDDDQLEHGADNENEARTIQLWTALQGATQLAKMQRFASNRFSPRAVGRGIYRAMLTGWGASRDDLDRAIARVDAHISAQATNTRNRI